MTRIRLVGAGAATAFAGRFKGSQIDRRFVGGLVSLLVLAAMATSVAAAQAETQTLVSSSANSLCIKPTAIFAGLGPSPTPYYPAAGYGYNYLPLDEEHLPAGTPFPDTGSACGDPSVTHATDLSAADNTYGGQIQGVGSGKKEITPTWVGINSEGGDTEAPGYYIYDTTFSIKCTAGAEIVGKMVDNNAAGAFLNGHPIGYQDLKQGSNPNDEFAGNAQDFSPNAFGPYYAEVAGGWPFGENWGNTKPTSGYGPHNFQVPSSDFNVGSNTLQFLVEDGGPVSSSTATGLEFIATVTSKSCVGAPWYSNGKILPEGQNAQTYSWGKVTFSSPAIEELVHGSVSCKKSDAGNVWNEGGNGFDNTVLFELYECEAPACPGVSVTSSGLPWPSENYVEPGGVVRDRTKGIGLTIKCGERELHFGGELTPKVVNGTKTKASYEEFGTGSGTLEGKESGVVQVTGYDNMAGFEQGDELITTKGGKVKKEPPVEEPKETTKTNYLALGDSVSFGYTEEKFNEYHPYDEPRYFEHGFDNFFVKDLASSKEAGPGIRVVNDSCPGETSDGLIGENPELGGQASSEWRPCAYHNVDGLELHNEFGAVSQLENALSILAEPTAVKAITLNIGSNDELHAVANCENPAWLAEHDFRSLSQCVEFEVGPEGYTFPGGVFHHIVQNIGDTVGVLDRAGYKGPIVVLGFYNPYSFTLPGTDALQESLNKAVEEGVVKGYSNVTFANPFPVFNKGKTPAQEQASICTYTEMCNPNVQQSGGSPEGKDGDIHPTVVGYEELAALVNKAYLANPAH